MVAIERKTFLRDSPDASVAWCAPSLARRAARRYRLRPVRFFPGGPWRFEDRFGVQWLITLTPPSEQKPEPATSSRKLLIVEGLVYGTFDHSGATHDSRASVLLAVYDELTNRRLSREFNRPTDDPRRILRNFDVEIRKTLVYAMAADIIRIEKVPERPWPFPDNLFPEKPVPAHLDVPAPEQTTFIAIRLVDQDGQPVPRRAVHLVLADKSEQDGFVDGDGRFRLEDVPPGTCTLTFPDLDLSDFSAPNIQPGQDESAGAGPVQVDPPTSGFAYTAEPSDTLSSVAERYGFLHFATIWNQSTNASLRAVRVDPHVLLEGDGIVVPTKRTPTLSVPTGIESTYTVFTQVLRLKLQTIDATGSVLPVDGTTLQVDGTESAPTVAGGYVDLAIPRDAKEVTFKKAADDTDSFATEVGALPPLREAGGPEARLENLGYGFFGDDSALQQDDPNDEDPDVDERLELALELFQEAAGQSPTGDVTDDVLTQLRDRAGA